MRCLSRTKNKARSTKHEARSLMNIVLATLEYPTEPYRAGGMCWAFAKIARGLKARGHEVRVAVPAQVDGTVLDEAGIPVHRYRVEVSLPKRLDRALSWRFPLGVAAYNQACSLDRTLVALHAETHIDVVLAALAPDSYFAAGCGRWPYVVRVSSHWPLMDISNFVPQSPNIFFADWMEQQVCRRAAARISPSRLHKEIFEAAGAGPTDCIITPMTATAAPAQATSAPVLPGRFVLFHGSLQAKKGSLVLADALVEVLAAQPDLHVVFTGRDLAVPGLGRMADLIRKKLAAFPDRVHLVGVVEQAVAFRYLEKAEWVILPSIMDNLPNAMLEAMWNARPVLVTRRSGTDDLIVDGENGLVVEPGDAASLRDGILRGLAMPLIERAAMGRRARATVEQACDPARAAAAFEAVLETARTSHRSVAPAVAGLRRRGLQVRWLIHFVRYVFSGPTARERRALEHLASRFLPGVAIRYP